MIWEFPAVMVAFGRAEQQRNVTRWTGSRTGANFNKFGQRLVGYAARTARSASPGDARKSLEREARTCIILSAHANASATVFFAPDWLATHKAL